jgi:hypothetical protein
MFKSTARSMAKLKTKNVFIDTGVFDAANLNFESTAFKELVRLVEAEFVRVFLTTVTPASVAPERMGQPASDCFRVHRHPLQSSNRQQAPTTHKPTCGLPRSGHIYSSTRIFSARRGLSECTMSTHGPNRWHWDPMPDYGHGVPKPANERFMTILIRLEQWKQQGRISPEQHAHLAGLSCGEPFSLFLELNVLLYASLQKGTR